MMKYKRTLFASFLIVVTQIWAGTLNVPSQYSTIQEAIDAAADGDTVLVADGEYFENIKFNGKGIVVGSHFIIDGNTGHIVNTIIDGSQPVHADTASCVLFINEEDSTSVLEGFTLTGGTGTKWRDEHGAGNYYEGGGILAAFSAPVIKHNIITGNEAIRKGGGTVSAGGGGIRCGDGNPTIEGNIISYNKGRYGGGIVLNYSAGTVRNNIIVGNEVTSSSVTQPVFGGGGIWTNQEGPIVIVNNTIVNNVSTGSGGQAGGRGGGLLLWGTEVTVMNNIVWGNTQSRDGQMRQIGGIVTAEYNNVEDGFSGEGNISSEPMFELYNFLLNENSPCIDAGNPDPMYNDPSSGGMAVYPSLGSARSDIGAYGGSLRFLFEQNIVSVEDETEMLGKSFSLKQNYPNPFNPTTRISFSLPKAGPVSLKVYDALGNEIMNREFTGIEGGNSIDFDGGNISAGVYFYQIRFENNVNTKKMMLLK